MIARDYVSPVIVIGGIVILAFTLIVAITQKSSEVVVAKPNVTRYTVGERWIYVAEIKGHEYIMNGGADFITHAQSCVCIKREVE